MILAYPGREHDEPASRKYEYPSAARPPRISPTLGFISMRIDQFPSLSPAPPQTRFSRRRARGTGRKTSSFVPRHRAKSLPRRRSRRRSRNFSLDAVSFFSQSDRWSRRRYAKATIVKVGFECPLVGNTALLIR